MSTNAATRPALVDGEKVYLARLRAGLFLTQVEGISPSYLAQIERGVHQPSGPKLAQIAKALGVKVDDLLVKQSK